MSKAKRLCRGCNTEHYIGFFAKGRRVCQRCAKHEGRKRTLSKYGLTPEQYAEMEREQGNCCAICKSSAEGKRKLAVDHDHKTGVVRGLLCYMCNYVLGRWRDNAQRFTNAGLYLSKHRNHPLYVPDLDKANGRKPTKEGRQYLQDRKAE